MAKRARPKYPNKWRIRRRFLSQALLLMAVVGGIWFYHYIQSDPEFGGTLYRFGESLGESGKKLLGDSPPGAPPSSGGRQATGPGPSHNASKAVEPPKADASSVKGEINREIIPAPPPSSRAAAAAKATARKQGEQPASSFSAPVKRETVTVYSGPGSSPPSAPAQREKTSAGAASTEAPSPADSEAEESLADPPPLPSQKTGLDAEDASSGEGEKSGGPPADMPFDGLSVSEAAAELSRKYAGMPSGRWGERVKGVTVKLAVNAEQAADSPLVIALTFDACGGGRDGYDSELIDFLREKKIPATLFVTSLWLRKHREELQKLAADPLFEIAAHGERHRPCSVDGKSAYGIQGTASMEELVREALANAREIAEATGKAPLWFRSGTAFYDELAVQVIQDLGMSIAGYSIAGDEGATLPAAKVAAKALQARHGDILLFHMNKPHSGTRGGLLRALPVLQERGAKFVRLSDRL